MGLMKNMGLEPDPPTKNEEYYMNIIDAQKIELELARKLFWLMAHDLIFFSFYNENTKKYDPESTFPIINTSDILVPGADAEPLLAEDVDKYVEVCKAYMKDYPELIWCIAKKSEFPWRDATELTDKQQEGVAYACKLLNTTNPYEEDN